MNYALKIKNLTVIYKTVEPVIEKISIEIPVGVICAVVGPNGAGKTTLIKAVLGLVKPVSGTIEIFDMPGSINQKKVAYIPQRTTVDWDFPISVLDVVLMGRYAQLGWFKKPQDYDKELAYQALEKVGLKHYAHRSIGELSGGQRQRVFVARALIQDAQLYIMDEPFIGVDTVTEQTIITVLKELRRDGKTIIIVHHDLQTLREYFDWMVLIRTQIIDSGPLEKVFTSSNIERAYGSLPYFLTLQRDF